jgi:hypothetical protein
MTRRLALAAILLAAPAWAHDPYEGIVNAAGTPCCGSYDCAPTVPGGVRIEDEQYYVLVGDEWWPVPADRLARDQSPDGQPHVCPQRELTHFQGQIQGIRCLILPMVM